MMGDTANRPSNRDQHKKYRRQRQKKPMVRQAWELSRLHQAGQKAHGKTSAERLK